MSTIRKLRLTNNKFIFVLLCIIIFFSSLVYQLPSWAIGSFIDKYSDGKLKLFNANGSFWLGDALLVANDGRKNESSAIALIHWHSKLGLKKYLDIDFYVGDKKVADIYVNKQGIFLTNLSVSFSLKEITLFLSSIQDLNVSGVLNITSDHILFNKHAEGKVNIMINHLSSAISKINPLGNYAINYDLLSSAINVNTLPDSVLNLTGSGTATNLSLEASISPEHRNDMRQFISIFGEPLPNGNYKLKVF